MLAPDAEADEPSRNPPEERKPLEQPQRPRHLVEHGLADHQRSQDAVVNRPLRTLDDFRREHPPLLHLVEQPIHVFTSS